MSIDWLLSFLCGFGGYTLVNTIVYASILLISVYIIFKALKFLEIRADKRLALSISPFVSFGSSLRVLKDSGMLKSCIFQTPGIYFLTFSLTFSILIFSKIIERKKEVPYYKLTFLSGLIFLAPIFGLLRFENFSGLIYILLFFFPWLLLLKIVRWLKENKLITGLHLFDGTVTSVSISFFGYQEQHLLPQYFINLFGSPFSFIFLKLIVIVLILLAIDKYSNEKEFRDYIKLIIGTLGAATGIRDFLRLLWLT